MDLNTSIDGYRKAIIQGVQELIKIPSVEGKALPNKPFGDKVNQALEYALDLAKCLDFRVKNIDGYGGYAEFGEGDQTMGILVHLDVVPEGKGWTYPPYGGEIHNGRIYGRGAIDDKGPAIGALYAMKAVMDSGLKLNKKVRMIFGVDEESGWEDMKVFFSREQMPDFSITPDGDYPVINAEKGILNLVIEKRFPEGDCAAASIIRLEGGYRPNMVPDECYCSFLLSGDSANLITHLHSFIEYTGYKMKEESVKTGELIITSAGVSAHGSTPDKGENAIGQMLAFLSTLGLGSSEMEKFILLLNDKIGMDTTGEGLGIDFKDSISGELTLNLGTMELEQSIGKVVANIRYPVTIKMGDVLKQVENALEGSGATISVQEHMAPLYVPEDHFLVEGLKKIYTLQTGEPAKALAIGGGTYARAVKNAVAFGAQFPNRPELAHQKDEYIDIEDLILHGKLYANAIAYLCT